MEVQIFFPGAHGVCLHQAISIFPADAVFDQVEQMELLAAAVIPKLG